MSHGDLRLLFPLRILLSPNVTGLHLHTHRLLPVTLEQSRRDCRCRASLVSAGAAALASLPTGGRGTRHLGDIDRGLPVCCDTDPGAEESFTVPEGDTEFLRVILGWAHIIDDACGPDAFDEHVVSWDDGSGGYSHHDYCFYLFLIYLVVGRGLLGLCLLTELCATGFSAPFCLMFDSLLGMVREPQNGMITT